MVDFLIVGQGIAGSVLALQLQKHGQRILVINNSKTNVASRVAAGIYNPITGRAMVKTWLADALFAYLSSFYEEAENTLEARFLHPMPIFRPFLSAQERAEWLKKATQEVHSNFIKKVAVATTHREDMTHPHGGMVLSQSGYLDVKKFLKATRAYLEAQKAYLETEFVYDHLRFSKQVHYQNITARQVIFCEGPQAKQNPFFSTLPFRLVKGELIGITLRQPLEAIYNRRIFVVPKGGSGAVVGATYDWEDISVKPTAEAREILEETFRSALNWPYTVRNQQAGIRPATVDRRPFIGIHPRYPQIAIFNGLGTKGVSLAPYFAKVFADHLLLQSALPREVQLSRVGFGEGS